MNQIKIGKFIKKLRNEKGMTQADLAEKLGVSNRAVSKWENGLNMPDVSLLRPICEIFGITINELLSAEKIEDEKQAEKLEENYICAVDSKIKLQNDVAGYFILKLIAIFLFFIVFCFFGDNAWWITLILVVGFIFVIASSMKLVKSWNIIPKVLYVLIIFFITFGLYTFVEFKYVDEYDLTHPRFYIKKAKNNCAIYKTLFYSCIEYKKQSEESKAKTGVGKCNISIKDDFDALWSHYGVNNEEDLLNSRFCEYDYDSTKDCDVVWCDENGTPLYNEDEESE